MNVHPQQLQDKTLGCFWPLVYYHSNTTVTQWDQIYLLKKEKLYIHTWVHVWARGSHVSSCFTCSFETVFLEPGLVFSWLGWEPASPHDHLCPCSRIWSYRCVGSTWSVMWVPGSQIQASCLLSNFSPKQMLPRPYYWLWKASPSSFRDQT